MRAVKLLVGLAGLALAVFLLIRQDATSIAQASLSVGWGLLAIAAFEALPIIFKSIAWSGLIAGRHEISLQTILLARWIRQSVSQLLPVAQVGGDAVGARVLTLRGTPAPLAAASTIVDLTFGAVAQLVLTVGGLAALVAWHGDSSIAGATLAGAGVVALAVAGFVVMQRRGFFVALGRGGGALSKVFNRFSGSAERADAAVTEMYRRLRGLARNLVWQIVAQTVACGEIVIACHFLGQPISFVDAFILQTLVRAMRAAAFFVPGGLGVQEGGLLLIAGLIGLAPSTALAIALIKRVREVAVGIPGLAAWYFIETRASAAPRSGI